MKNVFLLGAGLSKAAHSSMPTLRELSVKVKEKSGGSENLPPPLLDLGENVELWLTYLSQPQPWLKEYFNLRNRALFLRITEIIGEVLEASTKDAVGQDCPDWLLRLVKWWHTEKSCVITLNYDTLIERAAMKSDKIDPLNIYPVPITDIRRGFVWGVERLDSFKFFKLHGSVNWYYSGAASFYGEVLYYGSVAPWGETSNELERICKSAAKDKVPLLVPPTTEKSTYFRHETLRQIWLQASAALYSATCVYCIGYSLPITDLGIRFFLQYSRPNEKVPLIVVNIDNSLVEHYRKLLGNSYEIDGTYAATGVEKLVQDKCK